MLLSEIFTIKTPADFKLAALETFRHQYARVPVYRRFVDFLNLNPAQVSEIEDIPFLPIETFKNHQVLADEFQPENYFQSSGTANMLVRSRHYIADFSWYDASLLAAFRQFVGEPQEYLILGLLPNYSENPHSSLIYMVDKLMNESGHPQNQYILYDHARLAALLRENSDRKVLVFGVSFALLDFLDFVEENGLVMPKNPHLKILETGGMKGRKVEMTKDELLEIFRQKFRTDSISSEYSMTELLSQAYAVESNVYHTPNWMAVKIRSTEDPLEYLPPGRTGGINIIDLANQNSVSFIATQDLGKLHPSSGQSLHPGFEVWGRIDHADLRGCSLLVV